MRHALSQALRSEHDLAGKKLKLDDETRWQIAGEAVEELRRYGGWKESDESGPNARIPEPTSSLLPARQPAKPRSIQRAPRL